MATIQQRRPRPSHFSSRVDHSDSEGGNSTGDRDWTMYRKNQTGSHSSEDDGDWHLINGATGEKNFARFILNPGEKATGSITEILPSTGLSASQDFLDANDSEIDWGKANATPTTDDEITHLSSDVESYLRLSTSNLGEDSGFTFLPSHDGAGNFCLDDVSILSDSSVGSTSTSSGARMQESVRLVHPTLGLAPPPTTRARFTFLLEEPKDRSGSSNHVSDDVSGGDATPPSFGQHPATPGLLSSPPSREHRRLSLSLAATPHQYGQLRITTAARSLLRRTYDPMVVGFRPTITRERLREALESAYNSSTSGDEESVKGPTGRDNAVVAPDAEAMDLDSIPSHHPSFGHTTTSALFHSLWTTLRHLTERIMENEADSDSFGHLANEAALEGLLPFGSHLQLGVDMGAARPRHTTASASAQAQTTAKSGKGVESLVLPKTTMGRVGSDCAIESLSGRQRRGKAAAVAAVAAGGRGGSGER